jgi:wyosine [tRNA(Phe)-imidazoG37] synthetase (radical SAM superfamily)
MTRRHVFGPVLSRRLGLSLGIDLIPYKTCSYDCVYCECGPTTLRTVTRQEFFPAEEVMAELRAVLAPRPQLDSITLAGSGEPTLSLSLGRVIGLLKNEFPDYVVSVLTNGSLLTDPGVREELLLADRVIPTLTTTSQATFDRIHRPHPSLRIDAILAGMEQFRMMYSGALWLEVFVIPGLNTTAGELAGLKGAVERIDPDKVQLNTLDRPSSEGWVRAAPDTELERIGDLLGNAGTEIVRRNLPPSKAPTANTVAAERIRATLCRRPSTLDDLVRTTGMSGGEVVKMLGALEREGRVTSQRGARGVFYTCCRETVVDGDIR